MWVPLPNTNNVYFIHTLRTVTFLGLFWEKPNLGIGYERSTPQGRDTSFVRHTQCGLSGSSSMGLLSAQVKTEKLLIFLGQRSNNKVFKCYFPGYERLRTTATSSPLAMLAVMLTVFIGQGQIIYILWERKSRMSRYASNEIGDCLGNRCYETDSHGKRDSHTHTLKVSV